MRAGWSRRRFLLAGPAAAMAAACSRGGAGDPGLALAATAAGVEKLAADHYVAAGRAMADGEVGALVPPAVAALVAAAAGHHQQAHDAWNELLAGAGRATVTAAPARAEQAVAAAAHRQDDILGVVALALRVEDYAAQTYHAALPGLQWPEATRLAAQAVVANHQRQAVLRYLLGRDPVAPAGRRPRLDLITG